MLAVLSGDVWRLHDGLRGTSELRLAGWREAHLEQCVKDGLGGVRHDESALG
jgi:hypothetical protein